MILSQPRSIAILRLGALGDVCLTLPLIRTLQHYLPETRLHWIISSEMYGLLEGTGGVDFIRVDKPKSLWDYWKCYQKLKHYQFDVLLMPQATLRSNFISLFIRAKHKYGYDRLHARDLQSWFINRSVIAKKEHLLDSFLRFAEPFGIQKKIIEWNLPVNEDHWKWARQRLCNAHGTKWLAICPASSKAERDWSTTHYASLVNGLAQRWNFNLVLIGGSSKREQDKAEEIVNRLEIPCVNLVGQTHIKQLSAIVGTVDLLLSPDTGPVHIATAMRTPVIGLYAVAPPLKTGPYFCQKWVINKFPEGVQTLLKKDLSSIHFHDRVHSSKAMDLISVEEVVVRCEEVFKYLQFPKKIFKDE